MYDPTKSKMALRSSVYGKAVDAGENRILIYGGFGVGKTRLAAEWPAPLFLDCDRGENKYLAEKAIPNLFYRNAEGIYEQLSADLRNASNGQDMFDPEGGPYADRKTLVLDSWSKLNEMLLLQALIEDNLNPADDKAEWDEYGKLLKRQQLIMSMLKNLSLAKGMTIIVTALETIEGAEEEKLKRDPKDVAVKAGFAKLTGWPDLVGKYRYKIGAEFTDVWHYTQDPKTKIRTLWTQPHDGYRAKSRLDLPARIDNPSYDVIHKLMATAKPRVPAAGEGQPAV